MIDFVKDSTEAWLQRIRSPILGSVALTFMAFNWKPLWYLIFSDQPVAINLLFFKLNTSIYSLYLFPILTGLVLAFATPWLKWLGAIFAANPTRRLRFLQAGEAQEQRIRRFELAAKEEAAIKELEIARSERTIEAAKAEEAAKDVGGDALAEKVRADASNAVADQSRWVSAVANPYDQKLDGLKKLIIKHLGREAEAVRFDGKILGQSEFISAYKVLVPSYTPQRMKTEAEAALSELKKMRIVVEVDSNRFGLTAEGYKYFDRLTNNF